VLASQSTTSTRNGQGATSGRATGGSAGATCDVLVRIVSCIRHDRGVSFASRTAALVMFWLAIMATAVAVISVVAASLGHPSLFVSAAIWGLVATFCFRRYSFIQRRRCRSRRRMSDGRQGIASSAFARLMIIQVPVGVMLALIGLFERLPKIPARIISITGVFIVGYSLIVWAVIMVMLRSRRDRDWPRSGVAPGFTSGDGETERGGGD
jgi:putative flippase GtrA